MQNATFEHHLEEDWDVPCPACKAEWVKVAPSGAMDRVHADGCKFIQWLERNSS